ncbi:MAG: hypothetical protein ACREDE_10000 [Thermoplasmata archaeon]
MRHREARVSVSPEDDEIAAGAPIGLAGAYLVSRLYLAPREPASELAVSRLACWGCACHEAKSDGTCAHACCCGPEPRMPSFACGEEP